MKIKMKGISNIAGISGFLLVVLSFILNAIGVTDIIMEEAFATGLFMKGFFLSVDASLWIEKIKGNK